MKLTKGTVAAAVLGITVVAGASGAFEEDATQAPAPEAPAAPAYVEVPATVEEVADLAEGRDPEDVAHIAEILDAAAVRTEEGVKYIAVQFRNTVDAEEVGVWQVTEDMVLAVNAEAEVNGNYTPARQVDPGYFPEVDGGAVDAAEDALAGEFDAPAANELMGEYRAEEDAAKARNAAEDAAAEDASEEELLRRIDEWEAAQLEKIENGDF